MEIKEFERSSGVLMHISSLPGDFGIGVLGKDARHFVDFLSRIGVSYWQTLPVGPIDDFNSPYQSVSAFAGNPLLIDPEGLLADGLLTEEEVDAARYDGSPWITAYEWLSETRMPLFRKAFSRAGIVLKADMLKYAKQEAFWINDYALYMAVRENIEEGRGWADWENKALKERMTVEMGKVTLALKEEFEFHIFLQYIFDKQWSELKAYAGQKGISLIGDMPIYVSSDSADCWAHRHFFDLDGKGRPKHVAGVPPDYFSEDGQLWGNPVYNWKSLKTHRYSWWLKRLERSFNLFDAVRIDHFRAFSAYWAVPAGEKTAKNGKWIQGPGMDFFKTVFKTFDFDKPRIIAEDLGIIDDNVVKLLEDTGLPGMRVMQFAFIDEENNIHYPHNYPKNMVCYTGTHDNNTLLGYLWDIDETQRHRALDYIDYPGGEYDWQKGGKDCTVNKAFLRALWQSPANLVIAPIQDLCGYGADARMNTPGKAEGNWRFRITEETLGCVDEDDISALNRVYFRTPEK